MHTSHAAVKNNTTLPKLFFTIGEEYVLTQERLNEECTFPLDCRLVAHNNKGSEALTLQHLAGFCSMASINADNNPEPQMVTYLHNKGSFHPYSRNENWRFALTEAALSDLCLKHLAQSECNICGLQFYMF